MLSAGWLITGSVGHTRQRIIVPRFRQIKADDYGKRRRATERMREMKRERERRRRSTFSFILRHYSRPQFRQIGG